MSCFWLNTSFEDSEKEYSFTDSNNNQSPYFGVFNQSPKEIATWLNRPSTPFCQPSSAPNNKFYSNDNSPFLASSPPVQNSFNFFNDNSNQFKSPFISVF